MVDTSVFHVRLKSRSHKLNLILSNLIEKMNLKKYPNALNLIRIALGRKGPLPSWQLLHTEHIERIVIGAHPFQRGRPP